MRCAACEGSGVVIRAIEGGPLEWRRHRRHLPCLDCDGTGVAYCCEATGDDSPPEAA